MPVGRAPGGTRPLLGSLKTVKLLLYLLRKLRRGKRSNHRAIDGRTKLRNLRTRWLWIPNIGGRVHKCTRLNRYVHVATTSVGLRDRDGSEAYNSVGRVLSVTARSHV